MTSDSFVEASDVNARLAWISGNLMDSGLNYFASNDYSTTRAGYLDHINFISGNQAGLVSTVWVPIPRIGRYAAGDTATTTSGAWVFSLGSTTADGCTWEMNHTNTGIPSGAKIMWAHFWTGVVSYSDTSNTHDMQLVYAPVSKANGSNYFTTSETLWRPIVNVTGDSTTNNPSFSSHKVSDYSAASVHDSTNLWFSGLPWLFTVRGASHVTAGGGYKIGTTNAPPSPNSGFEDDGYIWAEIQYKK